MLGVQTIAHMVLCYCFAEPSTLSVFNLADPCGYTYGWSYIQKRSVKHAVMLCALPFLKTSMFPARQESDEDEDEEEPFEFPAFGLEFPFTCPCSLYNP